MGKKNRKDNIPVLIVCVLVFIGCVVFNAVATRRSAQGGGGIAGLSGVIGQIEVVASLLMVLFAFKKGFITAILLNGSNAMFVLFKEVIGSGHTSALPGVAVSLISIVTVSIIYHYVSKTRKINDELTDSYEKAVEQANMLKEKDQTLQFLAYYDTLTGMPNRALFIDKLNERLKESRNSTILYIDLDNFRHINDTFGHNLGDDLLKIYAERLNKLCGNDIFAAKIGGDEFGLILGEDYALPEMVNSFAGQVAREFSEPINIRGDVFSITASFGASNFPNDTRSAEDLFRCAETAMFTAKANGKNQLCFYMRR
ncbi:MAG: GGDEF domain-containing protein [Ruminococcus sp.]|nr:GGDEF domain-containing protein [Ruminococcus sp.]